jgi:hypothetical protein
LTHRASLVEILAVAKFRKLISPSTRMVIMQPILFGNQLAIAKDFEKICLVNLEILEVIAGTDWIGGDTLDFFRGWNARRLRHRPEYRRQFLNSYARSSNVL